MNDDVKNSWYPDKNELAEDYALWRGRGYGGKAELLESDQIRQPSSWSGVPIEEFE